MKKAKKKRRVREDLATTTANVAAYPVPLGPRIRKNDYDAEMADLIQRARAALAGD